MRSKVEFGDWQTPGKLAVGIAQWLGRNGLTPDSILEPTCGQGTFLAAALNSFSNATNFLGLEIDESYVANAKDLTKNLSGSEKLDIRQADFFSVDWTSTLAALPGDLLVIGNLPWVTNSVQGSLGSENLPAKENLKGLSGFDAQTGKSNFDISEWMVLELLKTLMYRKCSIALLLKTSVARKLLAYGEANNLPVVRAAMVRIDAMKNFGAAVDACLFFYQIDPSQRTSSYDYQVYESIDSADYRMQGHRDGNMISDIDAYEQSSLLLGSAAPKWRSGIKHDCSSVMELEATSSGLRNGVGENLDVEPDLIFPLLKGSDVGNGRPWRGKKVIVTQKLVGDDTSTIQETYPKLWAYLEAHAAQLDGRKSSIYSRGPRFSIFGVGDYSFKPYKIAICGLYKRLQFELYGPIDGKPVMFDDTVYFISFDDLSEAEITHAALRTPEVSKFLESLIFWDEKRPIKTSVLNMLDINNIVHRGL